MAAIAASSVISASAESESRPSANACASTRAWPIFGRESPAARSASSGRAKKEAGSSAPGTALSRRQIAAAAWLLICWPTIVCKSPGNPAGRVRHGNGPARISIVPKSGSLAASAAIAARAALGGCGNFTPTTLAEKFSLVSLCGGILRFSDQLQTVQSHFRLPSCRQN